MLLSYRKNTNGRFVTLTQTCKKILNTKVLDDKAVEMNGEWRVEKLRQFI